MEPVSRRQLAREAALVALAKLVYFGIRNLTAGGAATAAANARRIVGLENAAGLDWEHGAQGLVAIRRDCGFPAGPCGTALMRESQGRRTMRG